MALSGLPVLSAYAATAVPADELWLIELTLPTEVRQSQQTGKRANTVLLQAQMEPVKRKLIDDFQLEVIHTYSHLPLLAVRKKDTQARSRLLAAPGVHDVYQPPQPRLLITATASANQMQAGLAESAGFSGAGATVLVTDTGEGATAPSTIHPDFGTCTGVGVPSTCQLKTWQSLDPAGADGHGTNVSAIVARTARGSGIHFFDVADANDKISSALAFQALNWAVANQQNENIVAHNMSWGSTLSPPATCTLSSNVFQTAKSAGIVQVAAAGNSSTSGSAAILLWPACNPHVVSVGSIDTTSGGPAAWHVSSFSNAESVLTFLAPGAWIDAGGYSLSGTSMAAPHVAGVYAILRASNAWRDMPIDDLTLHLRQTGLYVSDPRLGMAFPVPMIHEARPIRLHLINQFGANVAFSPAPPSNCGSLCQNYRVNEVVTVTTDTDFVATPCNASNPALCEINLSNNRWVVVQPKTVLPAVLQALKPRPMGNTIFGNGFEAL